ncbi:hypothetical protein [Kosakonia sp. MUSA4]|uniref:hypothetical protein n=1 Tax=Kosakonia sp. MUSA4 TaxID=2067958 RepID=UPI001ABF8616|nr:hypothetical protein [Kosakonia sp. MUSA4]
MALTGKQEMLCREYLCYVNIKYRSVRQIKPEQAMAKLDRAITEIEGKSASETKSSDGWRSGSCRPLFSAALHPCWFVPAGATARNAYAKKIYFVALKNRWEELFIGSDKQRLPLR